jgi:PPOX class probable F420-dependent enzyme
VARLATADASGAPHVIPVCFAYDGGRFYSVLDRKPKRTSLSRLKRVRNILSNPRVALVLDHYEDDWSRLWYVLVTGTAELLRSGQEHSLAIRVLRDKYAQYRDMDIDRNPVIRVIPDKVTCWGEPVQAAQ